ncbi:MAG: hypothetical protein WCC66_04835 [Rhizobiaceae bacterium]
MNRFRAHIFRFITIALAFILSITAATLFLFVMAWAGALSGTQTGEEILKVAYFFAFPFAIALVGQQAFFPFIAFAIAAEFASWRSWLTHMLGGMAVALVIFASTVAGDEPGMGVFVVTLFALVLAAGAVGGTVYWLIAGRNAGRRLESPATAVSSKS